MNHTARKFLDLIGLKRQTVSHRERLLTSLGGFCGILGVYFVSDTILGAALIVASMGASAVLLFAVPHSALAHPWNVFADHLISAVVGVVCASLIADTLIASAVNVGAAIAAIHYL